MELLDLPPTAPAVLRTLLDNPAGISGQQLHADTGIPLDDMWRILIRMIEENLVVATVRGLQVTSTGRKRIPQLLPTS